MKTDLAQIVSVSVRGKVRLVVIATVNNDSYSNYNSANNEIAVAMVVTATTMLRQS